MRPTSLPSCARLAFALGTTVLLGACAAPAGIPPSGANPAGDRPAAFDPAMAVPITTRERMLDELAGRSLYLVHPDVEAELVFGDGTAEGTLVRPGEAPVPVLLDWEWVDGAYCRTGTVGTAETARECEAVTLYPGVGVELDYLTNDDPTEVWVFDRDAVSGLRSGG